MKLLQFRPLHFLAAARKFHISAPSTCSALFVSSIRATQTTAILMPHLDFHRKFKDMDALKNTLAARGIDNIELEKMKETFDFIESVKETKSALELKRASTAKQLIELFKNEAENEKNIKPLKAVNAMLRENLKNLSKEIAGLEENFVVKFLNLPNEIHPYTPNEDKVIFQVNVDQQVNPELAKFKTLDDREDAKVLLELFLSQCCFKSFSGYVKSSNCDFVKSLVVEGVGLKHRDANSVFILHSNEPNTEDSNLHLVGGASVPSFCALFAKSLTASDKLPIKMITVGRNFTPTGDEIHASKCQSTAAELFAVMDSSSEKEYNTYLEILEDIKKFYNLLSVPYRLVTKNGSALKNWETLSTWIEVFSDHQKQFVPVGCVSLCGSFISKRLLMKYKQGKTSNFLNVITGTVVDFKKLELCLRN
jgi:seryl-tRNA synthetase